MNDKIWTIIGTVFSVFGTGASLYSIIENKGIVFNLNSLLFVSSLIIGLILILVFGIRQKLRKRKKFSNETLDVIADYGSKSMVYLTVKNKSYWAIKNVRIEVTSDNSWNRPCLTDTNPIGVIKSNESIVRKIKTNDYNHSYDVAIIWTNTNYYESQHVFKMTLKG